MSIGKAAVFRSHERSRGVDDAPRRQGCMSICAVIVFAALLASCEQQVANAEQPRSVSSAPKSSASKLVGTTAQGSGKGKLVFDKPACQLPNRGGDVTDECSVIARIDPDRQGHLTYGPYISLEPGEYLFEVDYRSSAAATTAAGRWDAAARLGADEQVLAKGEIAGTGNDPKVLVGRFSMPQKDGAPVLEIRMAPALTAETEIKRLRIYEVAANP